MRTPIVALLFSCASLAHAQDTWVRREGVGACGSEPLSAITDVAIEAGVDHLAASLLVRGGQLFVCEPECSMLGAVDRAGELFSGERGQYVEVVPAADPSWLETWVLDRYEGGLRVHAVSRRSRRALDERRELDGSAIPTETIDRVWFAPVDTGASALFARVAEQLAGAEIDGVRVAGGWLALVRPPHQPGFDPSASVFVRRDGGETLRTCALFTDMVGVAPRLSDAMQVAPFGDARSALFVRVRIPALGYEYDMGFGLELWALVPQRDGHLALSTVGLGVSSGYLDQETQIEHWHAHVVALRTLGPDALQIGPSRAWQDDQRRPSHRPRQVLRLDAEGLVEPTSP